MATNLTVSVTLSDYLIQGTYSTQGIVICIANGLLLLAIVLHSSLNSRKEMVIMAGMAGVDVLYGLGVALLGTYRLLVFSSGTQNDLISQWACAVLPPMFITIIATQLTSIMNALVSLDRFVAVAWPIKYYKLDKKYAQKMMAIFALFGTISMTVMFTSSYFGTSPTPSNTRLCTMLPTPNWYNVYHITLISGAGCVSVAIYFAIFFVYRCANHGIAPGQLFSMSSQQEVQRRLTVTLAIITISTLIFFIIPYTILAVSLWMGKNPPQTIVLSVVSKFSTINNVVIYVYRQKEVRRAMWALCSRKKTTAVHTSGVHANQTV